MASMKETHAMLALLTIPLSLGTGVGMVLFVPSFICLFT